MNATTVYGTYGLHKCPLTYGHRGRIKLDSRLGPIMQCKTWGQQPVAYPPTVPVDRRMTVQLLGRGYEAHASSMRGCWAWV